MTSATIDRVALVATDPHDFDALGYIRVSTPQQAEPHRSSLGQQEHAVRAMAAQLGRTMGEVYCDAGVSGVSAADRPAFMAMLAAALGSPRPDDQPGVLFVLNASRWGRFSNPMESAAIAFRLRRAGWVVRFVDEDADAGAILPIPALAPVVSEAIAAHLSSANTRAEAAAGLFTSILAESLAGASEDDQARALLNLSDDLARRGGNSALMRVLSGRVDLVALLATVGEGE